LELFPAIYGGNPNLDPETARTTTFGIVLAPAKNLVVTLDYFDIRLEDTISSVAPEATLQQCLDTGAPIFCRLITRDPALGTLWLPPANIRSINQNIGRTRASGADVALNYSHMGVAIDMIGTYLRKWSVEPFPGAGAVECVGLFWGGGPNCDRPQPRWRHRLRSTWHTPWNLDLAATWRYIHSVRNTLPDAFIRELRAMNYLDIAAAWRIDRHVTVRVGINNVLDRDPPLVTAGAGTVNGNTWVQTYDALGRHVSLSLAVRF
jgi:outer membrane receptor protein involved in Fe transport